MQTRICELSNTGMSTSYYVTCRARRARPARATAADVAEVHAKHTLPLRFVEVAEADSCHYLRNGLADVGRVTGEVIHYEQPEPMRL